MNLEVIETDAANKVVIIVSGGIADYYKDAGVEVLVIDTDMMQLDDAILTSEEIKGFEHLVPQWIQDDYFAQEYNQMELSYNRIPYDDYAKLNGTCGRGMVFTTYDKLVALFGEPDKKTGKTQVEWDIEWSDGTISTIYDWKCYGEDPEYITDWSIGGNGELSLEYVISAVNK